MSKSDLILAENLTLPIEIAGQTVALVGIRGAGKTNTAGVIAESLLDRHHPIVVIDPTDAWWGLRSGYPVFIFGGPHGDIPLAETDGRVLAEFVVTERVPLILSVRHLRKNAQRRFVTEFCEELYHLKGRDEYRSPLTVFIDEAPLFVPQRVMGEVARTVGSVEDLISRGRNSGFGVVLISQRPATINKDVLSQADTILSHRLTSPQDRKALMEWIEANATIEEYQNVVASLATLKTGEAWVWAPQLDIIRRVQIRKRHTFDSSAAPKVGQVVKPPKELTEIDLEQLKGKLAATIEKAKADDPRALRAKIAALEQALKIEQGRIPTKTELVEVPIVKPEDLDRLEATSQSIAAVASTIATAIQTWRDAINVRYVPADKNTSTPVTPRTKASTPVRTDAHACASPAEGLSKSQQRILDTVRMLGVRHIELTKDAVARWMGIHPNGGRFNTELKVLRDAGYLDGLTLTSPLGLQAANTMATGYQALLEALPEEGCRKIVEALYGGHNHGISKEELAGKLGIHPNGGRFNTNLKWLRDMGVIPERGTIGLTAGAIR